MTPSPKNLVASILARLRNVAQEAGLSFNDILQAYVIERFLARLARSPHVDTVLLKGALMLRVWGAQKLENLGVYAFNRECVSPGYHRLALLPTAVRLRILTKEKSSAI